MAGRGKFKRPARIRNPLVLEKAHSYMNWINSRIKPDGWTASHQIIFHESATFMDYLHGVVKDKEAESRNWLEEFAMAGMVFIIDSRFVPEGCRCVQSAAADTGSFTDRPSGRTPRAW
jgi:hypothetical protein